MPARQRIADGDIQPDMSVEYRYYTGKEYSQLSKAKEFGLNMKCQKCGHRMGGKNKGKPRLATRTDNQASDQVMKAPTKVLEQNLTAEEASLDTDDDTPVPKNHTDKALQCKK